MIKFLKSLLKIAVSVVAGPAIALYNYKKSTKLAIAVNVVATAARIVFVASFFVVMPVVAVFAAKCWLIAELVLGAIALVATLGVIAGGAMADANLFDGLGAKVSEELDAEAAAV